MILSMTGFGRGEAQTQTRRIKAEIKSLNSKQLDLSMRVPNLFRELEVTMRGLIAEFLQRGKIDLVISIDNINGETASSVNEEVLKNYHSQLLAVGESIGLPEPADWFSVLLRLPEVIKTELPELDEDDKKSCLEACKEAITSLTAFRKREGERLYGFFIEKIRNLRNLLDSISVFENNRIVKIRQRLEEQLEKLSSIEYDKGRLEQELIFYIEKLDVTEEKTRLLSHLDYFDDTLGGPDFCPEQGQGKKLGFIAQEIGREINTLGSKANDAEMQKIVVRMKDELEQIKEQVLNVL